MNKKKWLYAKVSGFSWASLWTKSRWPQS